MKNQSSSLRILVIEDVKEHESLIKEAVHAHDFLHDITAVKNCSMAMELLNEYKKEHYLPHIIILDLETGGLDPKEFLLTIKNNPDYADIATIVLSSLGNDSDRFFVNTLSNSFYVVKPAGILEFMELINFICNFWSEHKSLPDYNSIRKRLSE